MKWSGNNNYATPEYLYKALDMEFQFDLDPCPLNPSWCPSIDTDGLRLDWDGHRVFCNPPWSDVTPWVNKAYASNCLTVFLLPARTDTMWFARLTASPANTEVRYFRKRVHFLRANSEGGTEKANPTDGTLVAVVRHMR
jgi:site-specific DNA-methyltransferase (adenine-specific)